MAKVPPKDLFDEKTMSFGDHLEELRVCLWKSLIGIAVGLVVGLYFGKDVMDIVKYPIVTQLDAYGIEVIEDPAAKAAGKEGKSETTDDPQSVRSINVDVRPFLESLKQSDPEQFENLQIPDQPLFVPLKTDRDVVFLSPEQTVDRRKAMSDIYGVYEPTPQGAFMAYLKVSLVTGIVLSSPWVFYQIWMFVAAGLYYNERHYVYVYLPFSISLFLGGVLFCFLWVLPMVLGFLLTFNAWMDIAPMIRLTDWISFAIMLPLMFGIAFQLPLVMLFLERIGLFTVEDYRSKRRVAVIVIAVASMLLTPSDPQSMIAMMIPLLILYEGGIFLVGFMRRRSPFEADELKTV